MRIVIATTMDKSFIPLFFTWISLLINSAEKTFKNVNNEIFLSIGCMPNSFDKDNRYGELDSMLPLFNMSCIKLEAPALDIKPNNQLDLQTTYPNIRRIMMLNGLRQTSLFDYIVYSDLDALFIRDPFPQIIQLHGEGYGMVASSGRAPGPAATAFGAAICSGFFSVSNLDIISEWTKSASFSQTAINEWVLSNKPRVVQKFNYSNSGIIDFNVDNKTEKLYLLPYDTHRRYNCDKDVNRILIGHCQTAYYDSSQKQKEFASKGWMLYPGVKKMKNLLDVHTKLIHYVSSALVIQKSVPVEMNIRYQLSTNPRVQSNVSKKKNASAARLLSLTAAVIINYSKIDLNQNNLNVAKSGMLRNPNWRKVSEIFGISINET